MLQEPRRGDEIYLAADLLEAAVSAAVSAGLSKRDVLLYGLDHLTTLMGDTMGADETARALHRAAAVVAANPDLCRPAEGDEPAPPDAAAAAPASGDTLRFDAALRALMHGAAAAMSARGACATDVLRVVLDELTRFLANPAVVSDAAATGRASAEP
jgi:hypothetical protein